MGWPSEDPLCVKDPQVQAEDREMCFPRHTRDWLASLGRPRRRSAGSVGWEATEVLSATWSWFM